VHFIGVPGLNLNKIAKSEDLLLDINAFHLQLIILQIGGNDLCKHSYSAESRVAHDIIDLADTMADFDLQLGFNARKYFATGYDVILMKCACVPGM
jgi:lysophospholipase L1-like esterase